MHFLALYLSGRSFLSLLLCYLLDCLAFLFYFVNFLFFFVSGFHSVAFRVFVKYTYLHCVYIARIYRVFIHCYIVIIIIL